MFSSDGVYESSGVNGPVLVSTRFVWPYGGRRVFITGSFTRWSEHLPMSPVEGCPTFSRPFYKFFVDGEWRHDESQPFVSGNYGIVNTVLLAREPDPVPAILSLEMCGSRSNMDVDNDRVLHVWQKEGPSTWKLYIYDLEDPIALEKITGCHKKAFEILAIERDAASKISEVDLEISRHRISGFLSTHTAYELLPESGKVLALDVNLPVKQAFQILYEQGIPVAPLWDFCKGRFVGMLSPQDFILILRELGHRSSIITEEELETHTISAWKEGKWNFDRQANGHARVPPRSLIHAGPFDSMKVVATRILQNKVATIPIIHSSLHDGSFPQLLHLASLSGILRCICRHFKHSSSALPILHQPICSIPLGTWIPMIGDSSRQTLAMSADISSREWSCAPLDYSSSITSLHLKVVLGLGPINMVRAWALKTSTGPGPARPSPAQAREGPLFCGPGLGFYADLLVKLFGSDITALAKDRTYAQIGLDEMSIQQALQLCQDANSPYGVLNRQRCQMCLRADPLHKVMERLANPGVRRVVIVEAGSKRVEGIISLSDVFRFLLGDSSS
ncbi:hypothetical protein Syun_007847 [Stephania yunnanensis]|uniref:CBS domain-containing protein n=1 Tax=Stephania yunnanensis TaxID=152371 RepID=A0AAP0KZG8_9MAGN